MGTTLGSRGTPNFLIYWNQSENRPPLLRKSQKRAIGLFIPECNSKIYDLWCLLQVLQWEMSMDHRFVDIGVTEQFLKLEQISSLHHEVTRKRVSQLIEPQFSNLRPYASDIKVPFVEMIWGLRFADWINKNKTRIELALNSQYPQKSAKFPLFDHPPLSRAP